MSFFDLLNHLLNLVLPAPAVALGLVGAARLCFKPSAGTLPWWQQVVVLSLCGMAVLVLGLLLQGHDGRMATYAALVGVCGTVQWLLLRGWKA